MRDRERLQGQVWGWGTAPGRGGMGLKVRLWRTGGSSCWGQGREQPMRG